MNRGSLLLAMVAWLCPMQVYAQTLDEPRDFSVERFQLSIDRNGLLGVEWAEVPKHLDWDLSLVLGATDDVLVVSQRNERGELMRVGDVVGTRVGGSVVGAIALFDWIQLAVDIPFAVYQDRGRNLRLNSATGERLAPLKKAGFGAIRFAPKIRLLRASDQGIGLAIMPNLILPAIHGARYLGRDAIVFSPELLLSKEVAFVRIALNLGYRFNEIKNTSRLLTLEVEDELFGRLGVGLRFSPVEIDVTMAAATSVDPIATDARKLFDRDNQNYVEGMAGLTVDLAQSLQLFAAVGFGFVEGYGTPDYRGLMGIRLSSHHGDRDGDGIMDSEDACPDIAEDKDGFEDEDGCPDTDNDQDGLLDRDDLCPNQPEDVDEFEDEDGCPDLDNDRDGVLDPDDRCPVEPEDQDGFEDEDGCPDLDNDQDQITDLEDKCPMEAGVKEEDGCPAKDRDGDTVIDRLDNCPDEPGPPSNQGCVKQQLVVIKSERLEILDKVHFATGSARIRRRSYPLLDNVAGVILAHPEIKGIRVEGHTDSRGTAAFNMNLSVRRANAVRAYLIKRGVLGERLEAVGWGEEKPIESNSTSRGRASNRRVEFLIQGSGPGSEETEGRQIRIEE